MKLWFVLALTLFSAGCRKQVSISVGTCVPEAEGCGIKVERQGDPLYELACKPPDTKLPMSCSCRENGTSKKKVGRGGG